jgi:serine/threonine protein kinase
MPVRIESYAEPIPGYKLIERIGGGGFGEVWKAEAPGGLHKAIKFVYGDLQTAGDDGARAEQELKALSRVKTVRHPYILSLERYDIIDGQLIIVMELADRNLWDRFKECRQEGLVGIPRQELMSYMEETAEALDLMNIEYQLQHLDIKPHNIFLTHNHVKVADFGLVKDLEGVVASVTGGVTPVYAAPETFDGYVSRFCDQYSLAIVYQELLTGQRPFTGTNVRQLILQHLQASPKLEALPPSDREIIGKALAKNPEERHKCCRDMIRLLREAAASASRPADRKAEKVLPTSKDESAASGTEDSGTEDLGPREPADSPAGIIASPADASPPEDSRCDVARTRRVRSSGVLLGACDAEEKTPPVAFESQALLHLSAPVERAPRIPGQPDPAFTTPTPVVAAEPQNYDATREAAGDGLLTPALVIALGEGGLSVLYRLRQEIQARYGSANAVRCVRMLYLDTDADAIREAMRSQDRSPLHPSETLLVRLNRPSHYLKPREGRELIKSWLDTQMLYRIPRSQQTAGVRALGRLAFCDNYPNITKRLTEELKSCGQSDHLAASDRLTGLGIRRRRPRVYIVSSLAGGTGGGMFLDLAYVTRNLARANGLGSPELIGLCLLPPLDRTAAQAMALGNAYAALAELSYFSEPGRMFVAQYCERGGAVRDSAPPFSQCFMLPLPDKNEGTEAEDLAGRAGELLFRELFSPLGRAADKQRSDVLAAQPLRDPSCQAFGMCRFAFPQRELVEQVARQLCLRLVQRWMSKDSKPLLEPVQAWVQEQWTNQELSAESFLTALQDSTAKLLGQPPESLFTAILHLAIHGSESGEGNNSTPPPIVPERVIDVLKELDRLLGRPEQDALNSQAGQIPAALVEASDVLVGRWIQVLTALVTRLVEEPEYRLAGAEESVRQLMSRIERTLESHERFGKDLVGRTMETRNRIFALLRALPTLPNPKGRAAAGQELLQLLRHYPKWRYQSLLLQTVSRAFVSLRGNLSDQLRELNFCRVRLGELSLAFGDPQPTPRARLLEVEAPPSPAPHPVDQRIRSLLPAGCASLAQAVEHFVKTFTAEDLQALDRQVQDMITRQFSSLSNVCMTSTNVLKNLEIAVADEVASAVQTRIGPSDVAALFLEHYPQEEQAANELVAAYDEAAPDILGSRSAPAASEMSILVVPAGPAGEKVADLARKALPEVSWVVAPGGEEIIIYREVPRLPLNDLAQFGPVALEAYRQLTAIERFTPHSRIDITFVPEKVAH